MTQSDRYSNLNLDADPVQKMQPLTDSEKRSKAREFVNGAPLRSNKQSFSRKGSKPRVLLYLRIEEGLKQGIADVMDMTGMTQQDACIALLEEGITKRLGY